MFGGEYEQIIDTVPFKFDDEEGITIPTDLHSNHTWDLSALFRHKARVQLFQHSARLLKVLIKRCRMTFYHHGHDYSWVSYQLHKGFALVLGWLATNVYSETVLGSLGQATDRSFTDKNGAS